MRRSAFGLGVAALVAVLVALGSFGSVLAAAGAGGTLGPAPAAGGITASASTGATTSSSAAHSSSVGAARALAVESGLRAEGISPARIHLPNFAGMVEDTAQPIAPSYTQAPAPMGVADIGLRNVSGSLVPYELNTTSVAGTLNITDLQSLYVDGDGPDSYGVQLNSVVTNVTIFGNSSYEFWSQNYVTYTPSTDQLVFGDEVWNFSSSAFLFPANSIYAFSPNGTSSALPFLYQGYGPTITIGYPFSLTLYLNTTTISDRPALYFNYTVANATFTQSESYDYLIFNSSLGAPTSAAPTPVYQADGYAYDPVGLINDMEIDVLGNDDGDTTVFLAADATLSLQYWNATAGAMQEVPSAYSAGQETGETSVGLLVSSTGGANPIGILRDGPGFVGGLWNYSAASGSVAITLHLRPANAFVFVNPGTADDPSAAQWVPGATGGVTTYYLPTGGTFYVDVLLSDYDPMTAVVTATGPTTEMINLFPDTAQGVYTPLIALDNAELGAISSSGTGTAGNPYVLDNNQVGSLAPQFAQWDDYLFPVFPGLLLAHTTAYVDVTPPSFEIDLPSWDLDSAYVQSLGLPLTNDLQIQLYDAANVTVENAPAISGWLSAFLYGFPESDVIVWNCTNVLIAANTFDDQGDALLLYAGTDNTIWGNTFVDTPVAAAVPSSVDDSGAWVTGVNESENGDLIYNNLFDVPVAAITPTVDPFQCDQFGFCYPVNFTDTWNVSDEPASASQTVNGVALTGSIVGTTYQGGNYWSSYGTTGNPFGTEPLAVPFNDSGWITVGGDYVPLVPFSLYPLTFVATGLPSGGTWTVSENGVVLSSASATIAVASPNGTFPLAVTGPSGYAAVAPSSFSVVGSSTTVNVSFVPLVSVTVDSTGLATSVEWTATIEGAGTGNATITQSNDTTSIVFEVPEGSYLVNASAAGYTASPASSSVTAGPSGATVSVTFTLGSGTLALKVSPTSASVWVDGAAVTLTNGAATVTVGGGVASVEASASGYATYFNNVTVASDGVSYLNVTLQSITTSTSSSGTSSTNTDLEVGLGVLAAVFLVGMLYFALRPRKATGTPATPAQPWKEGPPSPPTPPSPPPP